MLIDSDVTPANQPLDAATPAQGFSEPALVLPGLLRLPVRTLALLCIVVLVLLYVCVGAYRYQELQHETDLRLDRSLRIAREHALKVLDTNDALLERVMDMAGQGGAEAVRLREKELHEQLRELVLNKTQIQSIWLLGPDGSILASDKFYPSPKGTNHALERAYFKWHQNKGGGLFISEPLIGHITKARFFDMSRGLYLADGSFEGVASISLLPTYFEKFHEDLAADEPGMAITMFRQDGTIMSRWPPAPNAPPMISARSPVMAHVRARDREARTIGLSSLDGRKRLVLYSQLGDYPMYMGVGMDLSEITSRWLREMAWLAAFGLPPLVGLGFALRTALRRTREAVLYANRLGQEALARRRVEEALLQAQKLEALGRLTGGVAHDFNNALMVISNNLFLLKRKHPEADGPQIASIGRAIGSATKLTRQLLAFSRKQALVPENVSLQDKLPQVQELIGPVIGSQIQLAVDIAPDTGEILVDSAELELALINLAINARDAMPSGGRFELKAHNQREDLPPPLTGRMVVIEASDTGSGIDPALLGKVFEPFFTTKPVGEGTGLGLSQIYGLCQRAGGLADIRSAPGAGTSVRMFFPLVEKRSGATAASSESTASRQLGLKLLLVEDNDEVAAALIPVLEDMGCTLTRLDRGAKARDWLQAQTALPDLVLSDVVMPGEMDGLALARYIRTAHPQLKVLLMTGYAEQMEAITQLGFEVVPKPCSPEMLASAMTRLIGPPQAASAN
jgi:signal transduction histidine kinase/CheY-like chemotaxis protein